MGLLKTLGKIGGGIAGTAIGGPIGGAIGSGFGSKVGDFLFGSDPGADSQGALQEFGMTGGGSFGDSLNEGNLAVANLLGATGRRAAGARSARAGLAGSSIAEDIAGNSELAAADFLRKARLDIARSRLSALRSTSNAPRNPGLIESAAPAVTSFLLNRGDNNG